MPIHDWTRVDAGVFHGFHLSWIAHIKEWLNTGGLPTGYYADAEQYTTYAEKKEADVLTLHTSSAASSQPLPAIELTDGGGGAAVVVETSIGQRTARRTTKPKPRQRRLVIRHVSGHRVIAILEVVSPGNKDRRRNAIEFASKVVAAIRADVHVTILDLFPPTRATPRGLYNEVWREFDRDSVVAAAGQPLALTAFAAQRRPQIFFEFRAVGQELPRFPLMLNTVRGSMLPLAETYAAAFAGSPPYLRDLLSQPAAP